MKCTFRHFRIFGGFILLISFFLMSCEDNDKSEKLSLDYIDIKFLNGWIGADLMPVIPPDPISCQIELQLQNKNGAQSFTNLKLPNANVFLDSTNQLLGEIFFSTDWDGNLEASELDTIKLMKISLEKLPFQPPCSKIVYIELKIVENNLNESRLFTVDSLLFGCWY